MARPLPEDLLTAIEAVLAKYPDGASYAQIEAALDVPGARRTLQYHLRTLVDAGRLRMTGARRGVRYYPVGNAPVLFRVTPVREPPPQQTRSFHSHPKARR